MKVNSISTRKQAQMILDLKKDELKKMRFLAMLDIDKDEVKKLAKNRPIYCKSNRKTRWKFSYINGKKKS